MIEIPSEADVRCSAEKIFDVIIDGRTLLALKAYADKLPWPLHA
jgi:hypothetical protein